MGHVRLLDQGQWVDLSRAHGPGRGLCALAGRSWADRSPEVSYSPAVSVTVLILDGAPRTVPGRHRRARISTAGPFYS